MGNLNYPIIGTCKHTLVQCDCGVVLNIEKIASDTKRQLLFEIREVEKGNRKMERLPNGEWTGKTILISELQKPKKLDEK